MPICISKEAEEKEPIQTPGRILICMGKKSFEARPKNDFFSVRWIDVVSNLANLLGNLRAFFFSSLENKFEFG